MNSPRSPGFTLLELMAVIATIALLTAVAIPTYSYFVRKSQATEIQLSYAALRDDMAVVLSTGAEVQCSDLADKTTVSLGHDYATLRLDFEAVNGQDSNGFYPVFEVCASDQDSQMALDIAQAAYDEFALNGTINPGAVLTDNLVSFSVPAADENRAVCLAPIAATATGSGCNHTPPPAQTPAPSQPPAPPAQQVTQGVPQTPAEATVAADTALAAVPAADRQKATDLAALVEGGDDLSNALRQALATGSVAGTPGPKVDEMLMSCPGIESHAMDGNDLFVGSCNDEFPGMCGNCFVATYCALSCGYTEPASPEILEALKAKHYGHVMSQCYNNAGNVFVPSNPDCQELARLQAAQAAGN